MESQKKAEQPAAARDASAKVQVPQGRCVLCWGLGGSLLGVVPFALLLPCTRWLLELWWVTGLLFAWGCLVGCLVTFFWSKALHERVAVLREELEKANGLTPEEKEWYPGRVPWMPAWTGLLERALYCMLVGLDVAGGASFIGVWVGIKLAGGWQVWSRGTTYGRATFFSGLLGNAMSVLFGVVSGIVIRSACLR